MWVCGKARPQPISAGALSVRLGIYFALVIHPGEALACAKSVARGGQKQRQWPVYSRGPFSLRHVMFYLLNLAKDLDVHRTWTCNTDLDVHPNVHSNVGRGGPPCGL